MGKINVQGKDAMGRNIPVAVELTTKVAPGGEPVRVKVTNPDGTPDGREITISTKLADLYPERFEPVKGK
jgi:hypothetical protein